MRPDARHHVDEDIFEHRGGEFAQEEVQQHEVPDPQAASGRLRQGSVAVAGRRTDQGDIGAQRRVTADIFICLSLNGLIVSVGRVQWHPHSR